MSTFYPVGGKDYTLASSISSTATSITLTSFTLPITDQAITMATANSSILYGTLQPGTTNSEFISFTGITQNASGTATLTGVTRGLDREYPYTTDAAFKLPHPGQSVFILSDAPQVFNKYAVLDNAQTFADVNTFTVSPIVPTPTTPTQAASKGYVDGVALSGAPNASTSVQGMVQEATQAQADARTQTGSTGAKLFQNLATQRSTQLSDYVIDTGSATAYAIAPTPAITAYATGQRFTFKATNTNTSSTPTLAVSGLASPKTIVKNGAFALSVGDILVNSLVEVEYDGTNFQLLSGFNPNPSGTIQMYGGATAPPGWLLCDATSYLRADYPSLFAVISTTYGSADGTHFNVPDLRGRVPIGTGTGTGGGASGTGLPTGGDALTAVANATWKGEQTHVLTIGELAAHTHAAIGTGGGSTASFSGSTSTTAGTGNSTSPVTSSVGSDTAHNNIQPVMGVAFIIKT